LNQFCKRPIYSFQPYGEKIMVLLIALFVVGWAAVAVLGSQAYFLGEQSKPIHERNWRSQSFESLAKSVTGVETSFAERVPGFSGMDSYHSSLLPDA
jgi:biopolymer transport protein ExbB/TolQ